MTQYLRATHTAKLAKESLYGQDTGSRPHQHWVFSENNTHTITLKLWNELTGVVIGRSENPPSSIHQSVKYLCLWSAAYSLFTVIGRENCVPLTQPRGSLPDLLSSALLYHRGNGVQFYFPSPCFHGTVHEKERVISAAWPMCALLLWHHF
jgi:hypothetical protein